MPCLPQRAPATIPLPTAIRPGARGSAAPGSAPRAPAGFGPLAPGLAALVALAACGDEPTPPPPPPVPATVSVAPATVDFTAIGDTVRLRAEVRDQNGAVMSGAAVAWTSLRPATATVDRAAGLVTAAGNGTATIVARAGGVSGEARVAVQQEADSVEKAAGDGQAGHFGEALPVNPSVRIVDANGHPAAGIAVAFEVAAGGGSVSHPSLVTGADGIAATLWTLGPDSVQRLSATAAGRTVEFNATATPLPLAIVTDSLPLGRATVAYDGALRARGGTGAGYVWSLDAGTELPPGLALDADGRIEGLPTAAGDFEFGVRVADSGGEEVAAALGLTVCEGPLGLETGEVRTIAPQDIEVCGVFVRAASASAYYRVTVAGLDADRRRVHPVTLVAEAIRAPRAMRVAAGVPAAAAPELRPVVAASAREGGRGRGSSAGELDREWQEVAAIEDDVAALHSRIRQDEIELYERLEAEGRLEDMLERGLRAQEERRRLRDAGLAAARSSTRTFRLYDREGSSRCTVHQHVEARVIAENDHLIVYEEVDAPSPVPVANVERVLDFYSAHGAEVIERYFGGVSDVDANGKVTVLIDPSLEGVRAFVWSGDMTFAAVDCPSSNEMELVHMSAGGFTQLDDDRYWAMGGLVHEVKHVSSLYKRVRSDALRGRPEGWRTFHPTWIEEGTADVAKEMASRLAWERAGGLPVGERANRGWIQDGMSNMRPDVYGVFGIMARVVRALSVDPNAISFEPDGQGSVYGSGWHFHRHLRDLLAPGNAAATGADEALMFALNDSLALPGTAGIAEATGRSMKELLTSHAVALTVAGAEPWLRDNSTPRFLTYDFPTATELFTNPDPPGRYPWPVTMTGAADDDSDPAVPLSRTRRFQGAIGASGVRVFDFEATAAGAGAVFRIETGAPVAVVVARIPRPPGF